MFVCVFTVPLAGTPQNEQTNNHKITHPLVEFSKKYNLVDQASIQSMLKSNEILTLESVEHQGWNGSEFASYYAIDFIYSGGKRTETHHYYKWDAGSDWEIDSREVYVYENDRLLSVTNQMVIEEEYVNDYRTLFAYQQVGDDVLLSETVDQFWNGDFMSWENEERIEFTSSNGELTGGESSTWDGIDEWVLYERFILDEQENDLYMTYQDFTGTDWINSERQIFENFSINEMYSLFTEEMNVVETGSLLTLAELFPDYTEQAWDGSQWVDVSRQVTETEYTWPGEITGKIISGQAYESEWVTFSEIRITFQDNKPHELVLYIAEDSEAAELIPDFGEEFQYNEEGHLKYVLQKQAADENNKALSVAELVTTGRLILQWSGASTSIGDEVKPVSFSLGNAYPNPFNPSTVIPFQLGTAGDISIRVFDMLGRDVVSLVNGRYPAGNHTIRFDGSGLSSGVYLIRLEAPEFQETRRVTLLK